MQKQSRRQQVDDVHKASPTRLGFIRVRQGFRGSPYGFTQHQARIDASPGGDERHVLSLRDLRSNRWRDEAVSIDAWAC